MMLHCFSPVSVLPWLLHGSPVLFPRICLALAAPWISSVFPPYLFCHGRSMDLQCPMKAVAINQPISLGPCVCVITVIMGPCVCGITVSMGPCVCGSTVSMGPCVHTCTICYKPWGGVRGPCFTHPLPVLRWQLQPPHPGRLAGWAGGAGRQATGSGWRRGPQGRGRPGRGWGRTGWRPQAGLKKGRGGGGAYQVWEREGWRGPHACMWCVEWAVVYGTAGQ